MKQPGKLHLQRGGSGVKGGGGKDTKTAKKKGLSQQQSASNATPVRPVPCTCGPQENYAVLYMAKPDVPVIG